MLFKTDTIFGHIIDDTPAGPVYRDDGSKVDLANPRPCLGCKAHIKPGEHDPCIVNLPGTYQACCGHGLDRSPLGNLLAGYVGFKDGRTMRFSGLYGGARIREVVDTVLQGGQPPEGFEFDAEKLWWEGLSEAQRAYVWGRIPAAILDEVRAVKKGESLPEAVLSGEKPWHDGLTDEEKAAVWGKLRAIMATLVEEALNTVPADPVPEASPVASDNA